ncbi:MAG: hypothetical protein ABSG50_03335 [Opitutaceae bacterium]|jgi:hypothetical protein
MVAILQRLILPLLSVVTLIPSVQADSNLLENSPFLPPNVSATGAAQEAAPLELRSVLKAGGDYEFSLYDTVKKQSTWARLNEPGYDFVVKAFDPEKDAVTVELRNRTYKLTLKEAKITQLGSAPGQPQSAVAAAAQAVTGRGPPPGPGPAGRGQSGPAGRDQSGSTPALTPEQISNLQADINRRRELRRQATASPAATTPAQPPAPTQSR